MSIVVVRATGRVKSVVQIVFLVGILPWHAVIPFLLQSKRL